MMGRQGDLHDDFQEFRVSTQRIMYCRCKVIVKLGVGGPLAPGLIAP